MPTYTYTFNVYGRTESEARTQLKKYSQDDYTVEQALTLQCDGYDKNGYECKNKATHECFDARGNTQMFACDEHKQELQTHTKLINKQ